MAEKADLDLVLMSPNAKPPVAKIMDYGKFKYDQEKKAKENKKKQKNVQLKETRFGLNIDDHDLETKANQTKKFILNGDKVKVSCRFRGRELGHKNLGYDLLNKFMDLVDDVAQIDKKPQMEGRSLVMFISEKKEEE
jgi:translation initiation factor IF-3